MRAVPGVTSAAFTYSHPGRRLELELDLHRRGSAGSANAASCRARRGFRSAPNTSRRWASGSSRDAGSTSATARTRRKSVIVNETFARRFFGANNPIGARVKQGWPEDKTPWRQIVGVVNDVRINGLQGDPTLQAYLPVRQVGQRSGAFVVRADGNRRPSGARSKPPSTRSIRTCRCSTSGRWTTSSTRRSATSA